MDSDEELPSYQIPRIEHSGLLSTPKSPDRIPVTLPSSVPSCVTFELDRNTSPSCFRSQKSACTLLEPKSVRPYCSAPEPLQKGIFEKDASWNSSMESIVEELSPRRNYNTIEKETFFPQTKVVNGTEIQPRALWPASSSESLDVRPLDSSSEQLPSYEKQSRVSDVCSVFNALQMQLPSHRGEFSGDDPYDFKIPDHKASLKSPLIRTIVSSASTPYDETAYLFNEDLASSPIIQSRSHRSPSPSLFSPKMKNIVHNKETAKINDETVLEVNDEHESRVECAETGPNFKPSPSDETGYLFKEDLASSPIIQSRSHRSPSPSLFSPKLKDIVQNKEEAKINVETVEVTHESRVECAETGPKPPPFPNAELGEDTEDNVSNCLSKKPREKLTYGSFCDESNILDGTELYQDVMKVEKVCREKKKETCRPKNSLPVSNGLVTFKAFSSSCLEQEKIGNSRNVIKSSRAKKKLILEVSSWNASSHFASSQAEVTDSQLFQAVEEIETSLNLPQDVTRVEQHQKNPLSLRGGVDIKSEAPETHQVRSGKIKLSPSTASGDSKQCLGFQTARNCPLVISKDALERVQNIFVGCNEPPVENLQLKPCKKRLGSRACTTPGEKGQGRELVDPIPSNFAGFRTASNKTVSASLSSIAKVKTIFDGCDENSFNSDANLPDNHTRETVSAADVKVAEKNNFVGFQTASNKAVAVSSVAREKVRNLFKDCEMESSFPEEVESATIRTNQQETISALPKDLKNFFGFQTASNKAVAVSSAAREKVRNLFKECEMESSFPEEVESATIRPNQQETISALPKDMKNFFGFQTASNKTVAVSSAAREKVRNLFKDCEMESDFPEEVESATIRTNQQETISALPKDMKNFFGFQTASNKAVAVSSAAQEKVKNMFKDCDLELDLSVNVETERQIPDDSRVTLPKVENHIERFTNQVSPACPQESFMGFTTANKNAVSVSKAALDRVKNIFSDLENSGSLDKLPAKQQAKSEEIMPVNVESTANNAQNEADMALLEKDLAFFESFDWEGTVLPQSELKIPQSESNFKTASKRLSESPVRISSKRSKMMSEPTRQETLHKRKLAREHQAALIKRKGKVKPIVGTHLQRRLSGQCKTWREMLPQGPGDLTYQALRETVSDSILQVTWDNCQDYIFDARAHYKSSEIEDPGGIRGSDGIVLIVNDCEQIGVVEIERGFLAGPGVAPELVPNGWIRHHYGLIVWKLACYARSCPLIINPLTPNKVIEQLKYRYDRELDRCESSALKRILERDDTPAKALVLVILKITQLVEGWELLLSDGWYTCPARCDPAMDAIIRKGKLRVGTKIMTVAAELVGCDQGVPPLERPLHVYLKIDTNSTRRVQWFRRLGFEQLRKRPPVSIRSILPQGGNIACVHVAVVRVYPLVFMEKEETGKSVTRNARAEHRHSAKFRREQENNLEKMMHDIDKEFPLPDSSPQPGYFEPMFEDAIARLQEKVATSRDVSLQKKMAELRKERNVRSVLRIRVLDASGDTNSSVVVSWWQPNEDVVSGFSEGSFYAFYNLTPSNSRGSQVYLNTSRQTVVELLPRGSLSLSLPLRRVLQVSNVSSETVLLGELDVVGLVVHIDDRPDRSTKTVYLADQTADRFFGLFFWNGLQDLCCEEILQEGEVVGVSNVQWRHSSSSARIPLGYVNELTLFTNNSRSRIMQDAIDNLKERLMQEDVTTFIEKCKDQIISRLYASNFPTNISNQSVESMNRSAVLEENTALNKSAIGQKISENYASPRSTSLLRPQAASTPVRAASCHKRLQFLQKFGEAPPLSPIPTTSKICRAPFKPPTRVCNNND